MVDEQAHVTLPQRHGNADLPRTDSGAAAGRPEPHRGPSREPTPGPTREPGAEPGATALEEGQTEPAEDDRPLDPEKLLRLAGLVRAVLDEVRQMDPDEATAAELAGLHQRVTDQISQALPNLLRSELEAIDLALPFRDGATGHEVRVAYAGLIGWLSGLFQGLQAAMQFHAMQNPSVLGRGPGEPSMMEPGHGTGQYL